MCGHTHLVMLDLLTCRFPFPVCVTIRLPGLKLQMMMHVIAKSSDEGFHSSVKYGRIAVISYESNDMIVMPYCHTQCITVANASVPP